MSILYEEEEKQSRFPRREQPSKEKPEEDERQTNRNRLGIRAKAFFSFLLLISLILMEYAPINAIEQASSLTNNYGVSTDTTSLATTVWGILILHIVVFLVICFL
jgi:hypothetical protein